MVKGITFLGVRTPAFSEMRDFCTEVLRLRKIHEEPDFLAFKAPNGDRFELFGPGDLRHIHFGTAPVGGFEVDDIVVARKVLRDSGLEILSGVEGSQGGTQWLHFRGPDGNVYEVVRHSDFANRH